MHGDRTCVGVFNLQRGPIVNVSIQRTSSLQITQREPCSDTEFFFAAGGDRTWDF